MSGADDAEARLLGDILMNGGDEPDWAKYEACLDENLKGHLWNDPHDKELSPISGEVVVKSIVTCTACGVWKEEGS